MRLQILKGILDRFIGGHEAGLGGAEQHRDRLVRRAGKFQRIMPVGAEGRRLRPQLRLCARAGFHHDDQSRHQPPEKRPGLGRVVLRQA